MKNISTLPWLSRPVGPSIEQLFRADFFVFGQHWRKLFWSTGMDNEAVGTRGELIEPALGARFCAAHCSWAPRLRDDLLDFSELRGPVKIDLSGYSSSWWSRTYQRVGSSQDAQLRLALMKVRDIDPDAPGSNYIENVIGSEFDDQISGNWLDNTLEGRGGRDTLRGGDGDDVLKGGDARDYLFGGDGLDRLFGEAGDDFLDGGADRFTDNLTGGSGRDTFYTWYGYTRERFMDYNYFWDKVKVRYSSNWWYSSKR